MFRKRLATAVAGLLTISFATACGASSAGDSWAPVRLTGMQEVESYSDVLSMRDAADLVVAGTFTGFERGREVVIPDGLGEGTDDVLIWVDGHLAIDEVLHTADYMEPLEDVLADGVLSEDGTTLTVEFFAGGAEAEGQIDAGIEQMNAELTGTGSPDGRSVLFLRMNGGLGEPVPEGPGDPPDSAKLPAVPSDGCEIIVDKKIVSGLGKGEVFDPAKHYPGYDEKVHGSCLFVDPGDGEPRPVAQPARGDVDDVGRLRLTWSYGLVTGTEEHPVDAPLGDHPDEEASAGHLEDVPDPRDQWTSLDQFIDYVRTG
jgi:hypothetical protein